MRSVACTVRNLEFKARTEYTCATIASSLSSFGTPVSPALSSLNVSEPVRTFCLQEMKHLAAKLEDVKEREHEAKRLARERNDLLRKIAALKDTKL